MDKNYVYYNVVVQLRCEVLPDGKLGNPEKIGGWTNQMGGYNSIPMQKQAWRKKKEIAQAKEKDVQQKIDGMKTVVAETVYD